MTATAAAPGPGFVDESLLRAVFGTFVTGVVVVTTNGPAGMTCQTFCPLSLDPPLVGVAVARDSVTGARLRAEGRACFNILDSSAEGLARRFATRGTDRFAGLRWSASPVLGLPLLGPAIGWADGLLADEIPVGDHLLLVFRVAGLGHERAGAPLTYFRGRFLDLPDTVE